MKARIQRRGRKEAAVRDVSAGKSSVLVKCAALKDAQTLPRREISAKGVGESKLRELAAMRDAPTKFGREECAGSMGRRKLSKLAVMKDAPTK